MSHSYGPDVGDYELAFSNPELAQDFGRTLRGREAIGLYAVEDDRHLLHWNTPDGVQVILKGGRNNYYVIAVLVEEANDRSYYLIYARMFRAESDTFQRFWPEIAHLEDEWHSLQARDVVTSNRNRQRRRSSDDDIGALQESSAHGRRHAERAVIQNALDWSAIWIRQQPGADDIHTIHLLAIKETLELVAVLGDNHAGWVIGKRGEHRSLMSKHCPVPAEFGGAAGEGAHLGRVMLGHVKNLHLSSSKA